MNPEAQRMTIAALMEQSLAKQRESVRNQVKAAADGGWFTVPWPKEGALTPVMPVAPIQEDALPNISLFGPCEPLDSGSMEGHIARAAAQEGYSSDLLRAVIRQESAFNPCAVSRKGALGLMQLMPATAADMGVSNPLDPVENLYGGARFLGQLLTRYNGDLSLALGAYNAGPSKVDATGGVPAIPETQNYVRSILNVLGQPVD